MDLLQQLAAAALVIGLLAIALWTLKRGQLVRLRRRPTGRRRLLGCEERLPLTSQHVVHLVRAGDRALVVATSASGCTLLDNRPWRELDAARAGEIAHAAGDRS